MGTHQKSEKIIRKHLVLTLCGSSTQKDDFEKYADKFTRDGYCVFSINVFFGLETENYNEDTELKKLLMSIHRQKIRMADVVYFIRKPDGTLGDHAKTELEYANKHSKKIFFIDPINNK